MSGRLKRGAKSAEFRARWFKRRCGFGSSAESRKARGMLHEAQRGRCLICAKPFANQGRPTFDHVKPLSSGGVRGLGNLALTHSECNIRKGQREPLPCEMIALDAVNARLSGNSIAGNRA